jgi:hypothetical protein
VIDHCYSSHVNGSEAGSCVVFGLFSGEYVFGTIHCCLLVFPGDARATEIDVRYLAPFTCKSQLGSNHHTLFSKPSQILSFSHISFQALDPH